jgi:hypothetical protein
MSIMKIRDVGKGVNYDLSPEELPDGLWSHVQNMRFVNGYAQRFRGMAALFATPTTTPQFITAYQAPAKRYWVHAGTNAVFADDGTTRTEITPTSAPTGTTDDRWSAAKLGGLLVMTNGVNVPYYWNGDTGTDLAALTGWDTNERCASIHAFKNYLVALDITKTSTRYPHMVKWSHSAVPGSLPTSWDETDVTKDAGEQDIAETPDLIVDALPLGDALVIYKDRSMFAMRFIGQPYIFQFNRLPGDSGMLAKGCGAVTPLGHVVLTSGDVVLNTGNGVASIADGPVRRAIFSNIDSTNYKRAFVTTNPQRSEVLICYPAAGSTYCTKAAVWNWDTKAWGMRDLPNVTYGATGLLTTSTSDTWAADAETWASDISTWTENEYAPNEARLLLCSSAKILAFDVGSTDDGATVSGVLERRGFTFDDNLSVKHVRGVYPRIDGSNGDTVTIEIGASMTPDQEPTWGTPATFTVGQSHKSDVFVTGRYLAMRITSTGLIRLRSLDLDVVPAGVY